MNRLIFVWKFITHKENNSRRSWGFILPVFGVALGTLVVSLTFAIMDGMEYEIFSKLKNFSAPAKIQFSDQKDGKKIAAVLDDAGFQFHRAIERNGVISSSGNFRVVKIKSIDRFQDYLNLHFPEQNMIDFESELPPILIGIELANRLNLAPREKIDLTSPLDISLITGIPPTTGFKLAGIYHLELIDFDLNYALIPYDDGKKLFHHAGHEIFLLEQKLPDQYLRDLLEKYPAVQYTTWEEEFHELVSAMNLEKLAYSIFGFMIVFISSFNLLSVMSMSVLRKIPQIGILKTMGFSHRKISFIFFIQAIGTGFVGGIWGLSIAIGLVKMEHKFQLIKLLFSSFPMMEFPIILSPEKMVLVFVITLVLVLISSIYPAYKAAKLDPVKSIEYVK